jgi:hypothetical protein
MIGCILLLLFFPTRLLSYLPMLSAYEFHHDAPLDMDREGTHHEPLKTTPPLLPPSLMGGRRALVYRASTPNRSSKEAPITTYMGGSDNHLLPREQYSDVRSPHCAST